MAPFSPSPCTSLLPRCSDGSCHIVLFPARSTAAGLPDAARLVLRQYGGLLLSTNLICLLVFSGGPWLLPKFAKHSTSCRERIVCGQVVARGYAPNVRDKGMLSGQPHLVLLSSISRCIFSILSCISGDLQYSKAGCRLLAVWLVTGKHAVRPHLTISLWRPLQLLKQDSFR